MKKKISTLLLLIMILALSVTMVSCGEAQSEEGSANSEVVTEEDLDEEDDYDNGISFEEEEDGADIQFATSDVADFYGSWTATSGQSLYFYGNVDITIKEDNTWSGNVADVDLQGSWEKSDQGITLSSELFDAELAFTEEGKLVMQENRDDTVLTAVLTKK